MLQIHITMVEGTNESLNDLVDSDLVLKESSKDISNNNLSELVAKKTLVGVDNSTNMAKELRDSSDYGDSDGMKVLSQDKELKLNDLDQGDFKDVDTIITEIENDDLKDDEDSDLDPLTMNTNGNFNVIDDDSTSVLSIMSLSSSVESVKEENLSRTSSDEILTRSNVIPVDDEVTEKAKDENIILNIDDEDINDVQEDNDSEAVIKSPGISSPKESLAKAKTENKNLISSGSKSVDKKGSSGNYGASISVNDPNLTDDAYVVEAPSFIIPYVYEKPPKETISSFLKLVDEERRKLKQDKKEKGEEASDEDDVEKESSSVKIKKTSDDENRDVFLNSALGKYFSDVGMNLVQEFVQQDLLSQQQKKVAKDKSAAVIHAIKNLQDNLDSTREDGIDFKYKLQKCKFCTFKTESEIVMQHHMETPHMRKLEYFCNFCKFKTKIPQEILYHTNTEHGVISRLERMPYSHQCPQCPFEDNGKAKLTRHRIGCDKRFVETRNMAPDRDWEPPAKIKPPPVRSAIFNFVQKPSDNNSKKKDASLTKSSQQSQKVPGLSRGGVQQNQQNKIVNRQIAPKSSVKNGGDGWKSPAPRIPFQSARGRGPISSPSSQLTSSNISQDQE